MSLRARLQRWGDRLLGRPPWYRDTNVTISRSDLWAEKPRPDNPEAGDLTLADDTAAKQKSHRSAGVDPYANDAGFRKPGAWNRVDRK
jgi:hypothetical protein